MRLNCSRRFLSVLTQTIFSASRLTFVAITDCVISSGTGKRRKAGGGGKKRSVCHIPMWRSTIPLPIHPAPSQRTSIRLQSTMPSSFTRYHSDCKLLTCRYTLWSFIPKNLFEQFRRFTNIYFLAVVIITLIPQISPITYCFLTSIYFECLRLDLSRLRLSLSADRTCRSFRWCLCWW